MFLDRDGTLIEEVTRHGIASPDQLRLLPGVAEAIHALNQAGIRAVVVTNQPVVAKGMAPRRTCRPSINKLETLLGREHAIRGPHLLVPASSGEGFPRRTTGVEDGLRLSQAEDRHDPASAPPS